MLRWVLHHLEPLSGLFPRDLGLIRDVVLMFDLFNQVPNVLWLILHQMIWQLNFIIFELASLHLIAVLLELIVESGRSVIVLLRVVQPVTRVVTVSEEFFKSGILHLERTRELFRVVAEA